MATIQYWKVDLDLNYSQGHISMDYFTKNSILGVKEDKLMD